MMIDPVGGLLGLVLMGFLFYFRILEDPVDFLWFGFVLCLFISLCVSHIMVFLWCSFNFTLWCQWEICYLLYFRFVPRHLQRYNWEILYSQIILRIMLTLYLTGMLSANEGLSEMERYILILGYAHAVVGCLLFGPEMVKSELQKGLEKSILADDIINHKILDQGHQISWPLCPDLIHIVKDYCGSEHHLVGSHKIYTNPESPPSYLLFTPVAILRQTNMALITGNKPRVVYFRLIASLLCKFPFLRRLWLKEHKKRDSTVISTPKVGRGCSS